MDIGIYAAISLIKYLYVFTYTVFKKKKNKTWGENNYYYFMDEEITVQKD